MYDPMPTTDIALLLRHGMLYKKLVASVTKMLDHYKSTDSLVVDFYRLNQLTGSKNTVKDVKERFFKEKFFDISNDKINDIVNQISNNFIIQEKTKSKVAVHTEDLPDPE